MHRGLNHLFVLGLMLVLVACTGKQIKNDKRDLHAAEYYAFVGGPAGSVAPVSHSTIPQHPYLAPQGINALHNNSSASDYQNAAGPLGHIDDDTGRMDIRSTSIGAFGGMCPTVVFGDDDLLYSVCMTLFRPRIVAMDKDTLEIVASKTIPRRKRMLRRLFNGELMSDTSGGSYFSLSNENEAIIPASNRHVVRYKLEKDDGKYRWKIAGDTNLKPYLPKGTPITVAQPDWDGNIWFTTRVGIIGLIDAETDEVHMRRLADPDTGDREEIQNAFVVGPEGPYVLSDHAIYSLTRDSDGAPAYRWRTAYDRGTSRKGGAVNQGSGTTPSLSGDEDGYVIFADNADGRIRMNAVRREDGQTLCRYPLFISGESYSEDSMVVVERPMPDGTTVTSVMTNNSYGNATPNWIFKDREYRTEMRIRNIDDKLAAAIRKRGMDSRKAKRLQNKLDKKRGTVAPSALADIQVVRAAKPELAMVEKRRGPEDLMRPPFPTRYAGSRFARGVWRIDIDPTADEPCQRIWTNPESVGGVLKLSTQNGLVYAYTREPIYTVSDAEAWYLTAIDFETGDTVYRALVGAGRTFNNLQGPVTLRDGKAYMGVFRGIVSVGDAE